MNKINTSTLLLAFALGVLLTLLLISRSDDGPYVPFGQTQKRILDTRNGRLYAVGTDGNWIVSVERVGKK